jgi:hypothetical protein
MNKTARIFIFSIAAVLTWINFAHAEIYLLAKETDFLGDCEYKAISKAEYDATLKAIKAENAVFSRAQILAAKDWTKLATGTRYPGRSLRQRRIMRQRNFRTMEEAQNAAAKKNAAIQRTEERKEEHKRMRQRGNRRGGRNNNSGYGRRNSYDRNSDRRESAEEKRRESLEQARDCFTVRLNELMQKAKIQQEELEKRRRTENNAKK